VRGGQYVGGPEGPSSAPHPRGERSPSHDAAFSAYAQPLSRDLADDIGRLIERLRAREPEVTAQWHARCVSHGSADHVFWTRLLDEVYVPRCRSAFECLARGDIAGFWECARALGEDLADADIPFAVVVAHASFLKDGCAKALADDATALGEALLALETPTSWLVTAAADGYYCRLHDERWTEGLDDQAEPDDDPAGIGPTAGFFHDMVGRSEAMQRVFRQIARIAPSRAPVLILGETGTGKELAARAIHESGPRSGGPFIALNCAALPRELIESELFGHRRGAFSGALTDCPGLFRAATGGTLLLDEITEMVPELQAKLLRVLQERTVRPVGSTREEPVDVRILASTNRDPAAALRSGQLRPDLYYRLCVTSLTMPSLRKRRDDIPALVEYHLAALNRRASSAMQVRGVAPDAMRLLVAQEWPGNVRELFNVVENAFSMGAPLIRPETLELAGGEPAADPADDIPRLATFQEHERSLIERTLAQTRGNKLRAARELGISRKKLYARMARYGLMALLAGVHAVS
jgi:DNA-binding NtrC family response regulator